MSYKNVHKTFQKLKKLGLIEVIQGRSKRNAINYRTTPLGLFQILLTFPLTTSFLINNRNDPILQIILYQFFELKTIKYFDTIPREYFITEYVNECCRRVLEELANVKKFRKEMGKGEIEDLSDEIDLVVKRQIKNFIYTIVTIKTNRMRFSSESGYGTEVVDFIINEQDDYPSHAMKDNTKIVREERTDPNYSSLFPTEILVADKKFMREFRKMREEFEKGCSDFS